MTNFHPVVLAIIEKDNKYLFTKRVDPNPRYNGKWQLPGGGVEYGETPEEALKREIQEELGVTVGKCVVVPYIDTKIRTNWQGIFITYHCHLKNSESKFTLNEEASEYRWFSADEIDYSKNDIFEGCVEMIEKVS